jgi:4-diphosphocytidyl-2-C-methyl-D-erythritol kinase
VKVTADAPAKLNPYLAVGAARPDGYHHVDTVLVALDLGDAVSVESATALSVTCEPDLGIAERDNLAWRAATAFGEAAGVEPLVSIHVAKRIPAAAGLGGGSSDAAAVIACLATLWGISPQDPLLQRTAAAIGADVSFCLKGGSALYGGRGDRFIRALPQVAGFFALVNPRTPVSTAAAYAAFDSLPGVAPPGSRHVTDAMRRGEIAQLGEALYNNLTEASAGLVPEILDALALVRPAPGCVGAAMAGSGSTVFGLFASEEAASEVKRRARERGWWSEVARPRAAGALASMKTGVDS